ncbi:hypothetical protein [Rhizobium leguminosarum]|jgi:hypothetical protein|uniref:TraB/GumN family protein n=1 Tax=Rhizobium leguminosarum bv. trifolii (strain WSM1325) TaxID=395491 RepID=C6B3Y1_RHILS|nr:hypothetical protein [Rhizobium leguminosarum]ACS56932.1 hypothetical protein Rleg_2668 [Rhizobium leguminosarum bv. trifolii WSM1325]MBY2912055.1 TraB/GumN family protein [Rhizobium leguminosarum]MBY2925902.1 TraB/GumN family protein [Rhizobium leguminosarum]MBY2951989.1 TraB/GumN family protein [Rhizobium leguminosarum]MBY2966505.1 TraB/GumN family protein [Rhizobium leguminosarum]
MHFTRRQFAALAAVVFLPGMPRAADEENALFWRAKSPANDHVLFGYVRIRADAFPDIVTEGKRLIDQSKKVLIDVNPSLILSTTKFKNSDITPVLSGLTPSGQDEFKTILSTSPAKGAIAKLSGFEASLLLIGEGQHAFAPDAPSIGLALAKYGASIGRDVETLAADGEMQAMQKPLTLETVNSVGPASIIYLLELRRRIGPIGAYFDELYKARKSGEIASLGEEITARGIVTPTDLIDADKLRALLIERITNLPAGTNAFVILPIGLLNGPYSILSELRSRGAEVSAIG